MVGVVGSEALEGVVAALAGYVVCRVGAGDGLSGESVPTFISAKATPLASTSAVSTEAISRETFFITYHLSLVGRRRKGVRDLHPLLGYISLSMEALL